MDETADPSSGSQEPEGQPTAETHDAAAEGDTSPNPEGGTSEPKPIHIPKARFDEVNGKFKQASNALGWYQKEIGTPEDVLAFKKWKTEQAKGNGNGDKPQTLDAQKKEDIKRVMREADPEYAEFLERQKQEAKNRQEALLDVAEDNIRELAAGITKDEGKLGRIGRAVMLEINSDPKLQRRFWGMGDAKALKVAFDRVKEDYRPDVDPKAKDTAIKRQASKLPTAPPGRSTVSVKPADKNKGMGLKSPGLADAAWDAVMAATQE